MKKIGLYWLTLIFIGMLFACGGNKQKADDDKLSQSPENTVEWQGTYEGILPAADCPGIYALLAIDSIGYECLYKYIERPGIYVSLGKIKWNSLGDSITLVDDQSTYEVKDGGLHNGLFTLTKVSDAQKLPHLLTTEVLKDNKSGENALLQQYTEDNKQYAKLQFNDKIYHLKRDFKNSKQIEYADDKSKLFMATIDSTEWDVKPLFINDKDTVRFTILSPVNDIYAANSTPILTQSFDVLYLNGSDGSEVKLLSPDYKYVFTLPQTEASAKTAEYYNNGVTWSAKSNSAELHLGSQQYSFKEVYPSK